MLYLRNSFHHSVASLLLLHKTEGYKIAAFVAQQIAQAQKFIVPDAGKMTVGKQFDDFKDVMRLPYPQTALLREFEMDGASYEQICVAMLPEFVQADDGGAVDFWFADAICVNRKLNQWVPSAPRGVQLQRIGGGIQLHSMPESEQEEAYMLGIPVEQFIAERDMGAGPLNALSELMLMLSLRNVTTRAVEAPSRLNRKREKNNNLPLYEYRVLLIDGEEVYGRDQGQDVDRQVRSHFRRGHIRRLDEERRVWVRATFVHGGKPGFVDKDYKLSSMVH